MEVLKTILKIILVLVLVLNPHLLVIAIWYPIYLIGKGIYKGFKEGSK